MCNDAGMHALRLDVLVGPIFGDMDSGQTTCLPLMTTRITLLSTQEPMLRIMSGYNFSPVRICG